MTGKRQNEGDLLRRLSEFVIENLIAVE